MAQFHKLVLHPKLMPLLRNVEFGVLVPKDAAEIPYPAWKQAFETFGLLEYGDSPYYDDDLDKEADFQELWWAGLAVLEYHEKWDELIELTDVVLVEQKISGEENIETASFHKAMALIRMGNIDEGQQFFLSYARDKDKLQEILS